MLKTNKTLQSRTVLKSKATTVLKSHKKLVAKTTIKKRKSKRKDVKAANLVRSIWTLRRACENCPKTAEQGWQMQGAHILGVGAYPRVGSDIRNGFCLCANCHRIFEDDSHLFVEFVTTSWAEKYIGTLRRLASERKPVDWDDRLDFLKEIKRAMEAGEMTIEQAREYEV